MRPKIRTISPDAADEDGFAEAQAVSDAGNLTLDGALVSSGTATMDPPCHVSVTSTGNDSGRTFTFTGTDRYGNALTESVTGPDTTTSKGSKNFATVTQIAVDAACAGNISAGTADELETAWYPVDHNVSDLLTNSIVSTGGSATAATEYTYKNPWGSSFDEHDADPQSGDPTGPCYAVRCAISSYVSGTVEFSIFTVIRG